MKDKIYVHVSKRGNTLGFFTSKEASNEYLPQNNNVTVHVFRRIKKEKQLSSNLSKFNLNIKEVFKKYPKNEPNYNGTNYLTLVDVDGSISYAITYFNNESQFEPKWGNVVAFTEVKPRLILNALK
jgi:hypothetical protein